MSLPSVADTMNPMGSEPAPGASMAPEAASARLAELKGDPAFLERFRLGDAKAVEERNQLLRLSQGQPAVPVMPVNEIDVFTQASARAAAEFESRAESLRADGVNELAIYEYLNGRPIPLAQHQEAQRNLARLKADKGFQQRLLDGDPDARLRWRGVHIAISMPVVSNSVDGRLQPEIAQWEAAHKGKKPA